MPQIAVDDSEFGLWRYRARIPAWRNPAKEMEVCAKEAEGVELDLALTDCAGLQSHGLAVVGARGKQDALPDASVEDVVPGARVCEASSLRHAHGSRTGIGRSRMSNGNTGLRIPLLTRRRGSGPVLLATREAE